MECWWEINNNNHNSSKSDINTEDASTCNPEIINSEIDDKHKLIFPSFNLELTVGALLD